MPGDDERGRAVTVTNKLEGVPQASAAERLVALVSAPRLLLVACVVLAVWFVFVPLSALLYNAFTEDTGFGPGGLSLDNFVEAYYIDKYVLAMPLQAPTGVCMPPTNIYNLFFHYTANLKQKIETNKKSHTTSTKCQYSIPDSRPK